MKTERTLRQIPLVDLNAQYHRYREELDAALASCVSVSRFVGGEVCRDFERAFARFCGGGFAVGCGNGTDALILAITALLGEGPGEIITATHTFAATAEAIALAGFRPVLVDVDPATGLMDLDEVAARITPRTRALMPVHLYGQMVAMDRVAEIAREYDLVVIEDAAQAHGAQWRGQMIGALSDAAAFSFYPGKNLGAWGDGGAVFTRDETLAERIGMLANHGRRDKYIHQSIGRNSRLDSIQAAVLGAKLGHLEEWNRARQSLAERYRRHLEQMEAVRVLEERPEAHHVYHLFVIDVDDREALAAHLKRHGIATGIHYPVPIHAQPAFAYLGHGHDAFPRASRLAKRILSLPLFPELAEADVDRICETIASFYRGGVS